MKKKPTDSKKVEFHFENEKEKKNLYLALRNTGLVLKESLMLIISFENHISYFGFLFNPFHVCIYVVLCSCMCVEVCELTHVESGASLI